MLKYFSPFGRTKRLEYWCLLSVSAFFFFLGYEVYQSVEGRYDFQQIADDWKEYSVVLVLFLLGTTLILYTARRRCEDIGISTIYAFFIFFGKIGIIIIIVLGIPRTDFARDPRVLKKIDALNDRIDAWEEKIKSLWLFLKKYYRKVMKKNDNIKKKR